MTFAVRLQLHALACNLSNFLRTMATPGPLKEKLSKIGGGHKPWALHRVPIGGDPHTADDRRTAPAALGVYDMKRACYELKPILRFPLSEGRLGWAARDLPFWRAFTRRLRLVKGDNFDGKLHPQRYVEANTGAAQRQVVNLL